MRFFYSINQSFLEKGGLQLIWLIDSDLIAKHSAVLQQTMARTTMDSTLVPILGVSDICIASDSTVWLTGGSIFRQQLADTFVISYERNLSTQEMVTKLVVLSPDNVYAAGSVNGDYGILLHYDGTNWQKINLGNVPPIIDLIAGTDSDGRQIIYCVAKGISQSEIIQINDWDKSVRQIPTPTTGKTYSLWLHTPFLWATGTSFSYRLNGSWKNPLGPTGHNLYYDIRGCALNDIIATGPSGIAHFNGIEWSKIPANGLQFTQGDYAHGQIAVIAQPNIILMASR